MKIVFLKKYNRIIAFLLSLLGIAIPACRKDYGIPALEYGVPSATFKISGKVTNQENAEIPNTRVVLRFDTSYTDENGNYQVQAIDFPENQEFTIEFDDVDGEQNGAYQSLDTNISFIDPAFIGGSGNWDPGETSKEVNVKLKRILE